MKPEIFFKKYDLFADASIGLAKMRELVLQLAVQGRLVTQCPEDEPGDALAVLISKDRAAFVKERNVARQRVFDPVADDQIPFTLPGGWVWTRLGNLCRVQAGFAFESAAFVQGDAGVPMIRIRDITSDRTQVNYVGEYRDEFLVNAGDYLVGMDGNFTVSKWRGPRALLNQRVSRLQWYSNRLEPSFFAIAAQYRLSELQGTKAYTTVDHLSSGQIENAVVPLPPLAEQKRIVAKVDELMTLCDRLEMQQQERETRHAALARASLARFSDAPTPANLNFLFYDSYAIEPNDLREAILSLAVKGELVPQDPNDEPAEDLLVRVCRDKAEMARVGTGRPFKLLLPVLDDEVPNELPASWKWVRTETISEAVVDCPHSTPMFVPTGVVCLDTNCFKEGQLISHKIRFVSEKTYEERVRRLVPRAGDIVFAREGSVGASVIVPENMRCCLGQRVMLFRLMPGVSARFFSLALSEASSLERLLALHKGIGAKHVNVADMRNALLPLPPLAEQRRIVAKVDQLMALVNQLETQLTDSRTTAGKLMEAIVDELTAEA